MFKFFSFNRLRADKKAMRNSLVRFGKRTAYRPAGEAFLNSIEEEQPGGAQRFVDPTRLLQQYVGDYEQQPQLLRLQRTPYLIDNRVAPRFL